MRILAIETTDQSGSVAALEADRVVASHDLDPALRSAVSLAPAIAKLLQEVNWQPRDVKLVAVASGPGSFTGLRVGVTTAKMFAYATGGEVLGINTLEAIAFQASPDVHQLWTIVDAQRDQVFAGRFSKSSTGNWQWQGETMLLDNAAWLLQLSSGAGNELAVSGPALAKLAEKIPAGVAVIENRAWFPKAAAVGSLAWRQYQAGRREQLGALVPHYFRASAAEEKRAKPVA